MRLRPSPGSDRKHALVRGVAAPAATLALFAVASALTTASPAEGAGSRDVAALQVALRAVGLYGGTIDGIAGPATAGGVRRLQARNRLAVDGIAGPATRAALRRRGRPSFGSRTMRSGDAGWDVAALQFALAWRGFPSGTFDGGFGPHTEAAVRRFQAFAALGVDGVAGPATIRALRAAPIPRSPIRLISPLRRRRGDGFGPRGNRFHTGIDYPAQPGMRVGSAGRGRVVSAGWNPGGYGNLVVIEHPRGVRSMYAHLSTIAVRAGQWVGAGARIGSVGATGFATGPHLHLELRLRGAAVDPLTALRR